MLDDQLVLQFDLFSVGLISVVEYELAMTDPAYDSVVFMILTSERPLSMQTLRASSMSTELTVLNVLFCG
jgi:hypothetical protein